LNKKGYELILATLITTQESNVMHKVTTLILLLLTMNTYADSKIQIFTDKAPTPIGTYSQAINSQGTIYISGQIGMLPKTGKLIQGGFKNQVKQVFENIKAITDASHQSINSIIKLNVYLTNLSDFDAVNESMSYYFTAPFPARSLIEVKKLPKGAAIEIEAILQAKI
jgi:reactive intermediate/imine deaminase